MADVCVLLWSFKVVLHYQSVTEQAHIKRLVSQLNKSTGEVIKRKPRYVFLQVNLFVFCATISTLLGLRNYLPYTGLLCNRDRHRQQTERQTESNKLTGKWETDRQWCHNPLGTGNKLNIFAPLQNKLLSWLIDLLIGFCSDALLRIQTQLSIFTSTVLSALNSIVTSRNSVDSCCVLLDLQ